MSGNSGGILSGKHIANFVFSATAVFLQAAVCCLYQGFTGFCSILNHIEHFVA